MQFIDSFFFASYFIINCSASFTQKKKVFDSSGWDRRQRCSRYLHVIFLSKSPKRARPHSHYPRAPPQHRCDECVDLVGIFLRPWYEAFALCRLDRSCHRAIDLIVDRDCWLGNCIIAQIYGNLSAPNVSMCVTA